MDLTKILLSVITFGGIILGFFIRMWMNGLRDQNVSLQLDLTKLKEETGLNCDKIHRGVNALLHTHALAGDCGEMVKMEAKK